jgi:hypothetical protein
MGIDCDAALLHSNSAPCQRVALLRRARGSRQETMRTASSRNL